MTLSFKNRLRVPDDVMVSEVGGEAVLLNLCTEEYFGLDDVGTQMWSLVTEAESIEKAFQSLLDIYDVEPEQLKTDLQALLNKLDEHGLVEVVNDETRQV